MNSSQRNTASCASVRNRNRYDRSPLVLNVRQYVAVDIQELTTNTFLRTQHATEKRALAIADGKHPRPNRCSLYRGPRALPQPSNRLGALRCMWSLSAHSRMWFIALYSLRSLASRWYRSYSALETVTVSGFIVCVSAQPETVQTDQARDTAQTLGKFSFMCCHFCVVEDLL